MSTNNVQKVAPVGFALIGATLGGTIGYLYPIFGSVVFSVFVFGLLGALVANEIEYQWLKRGPSQLRYPDSILSYTLQQKSKSEKSREFSREEKEGAERENEVSTQDSEHSFTRSPQIFGGYQSQGRAQIGQQQQFGGQSGQSYSRYSAQPSGSPFSNQTEESSNQPPVDILETPEEIILYADLAGFEEEDVRTRIDGTNFTIFAQRIEQYPDNSFFIQRERPITTVQRTLRLPAPTEIGNETITFDSSVLKIVFPKKDEEETQRERNY